MRRKACGTSSSSCSASRWRCRFSIPISSFGYLIGIAFFGLFQAIFMANAGGAWDNAKKIVEVDMRQKERTCTPQPSSATRWAIPSRTRAPVAMNPVIKFTTLFGLLAWKSP
jgi:K(+)-stimulated pyrophosphate-energized sodium pump